ncbi:MAG: stage II sporulation protein P [Ruthenibacterium sp.]
MYKKRRALRLLLPTLVGILCVATLGSSVLAAPLVPFHAPEAAAYLASFLCAPSAAIAATKAYFDDNLAVPVAQTFDENDITSGFWTQMPSEGEILPQPPPAAPQSSTVKEPEIAPEGSAPLIEAHYAQGNGAIFMQSGAATVRNCTELPAAEVAAEMMQELPFVIEKNSDAPQVFIMHTHATEAYESAEHNYCDPNYSARNRDITQNMVSVGAEIAAKLNAAGIVTLQDATLHDYPSYNGSYAKSNATVRRYLQQYPSIKVVLDVHRDAIQKDDGTRIKPIAMVDGMKAAQVMIICGCDVDGNLPNCKQNLRFASRWQDKIESMYPGLTRPALFDYRYYNQDLTTGSLLIEVGGHANTLEEAKYSGRMVGTALATLLTEG